MKTTKANFAKEIENLSNRFAQHRNQYEHSSFNETDLRNEFLNKIFKSLGWDIENEAGVSPQHKEVWMERGDCNGKRPDYNFRLEGKTRFYLEAKAPHININTPESIHQAKSYSWSTTESIVPFSVLSNFKEILVYDTTLVPDFEYPERGLIFKFNLEDFKTKKVVDKLWLLSREEMLKETLLKELAKDRSRDVFRERPDQRLLKLLNELRLKLATSLYNMNKKMDLEDIQDTVGTLINRLLFVRVMEDRGTIDRRGFKDLVDDWAEQTDMRGPLLIKKIREEFNYINENFNGKLFHGDPLEHVKIEANVMADVIKSLYGRKCPFSFNRLDVNTLGHIYEQFLSHEIAKDGKRIILDEKEITRKSGGVFYTPKEVVEFMCKDALGPIIQKTRKLEDIKVLDPSCGSGTFLLTAYKMLLDECSLRLNVHREELPFTEKRKILLNCIYGIDIDGEASKVAILSLCLLALENEEHISKGKRLLPNLHENLIKSDSLIHKIIDNKKPVKIEQFPPRGKHFVILGNPPYLNVKRDYFSSEYKLALENLYKTAVGQWDTYSLFLERCAQWDPDVFSLIVPKPVLTNESQKITREILHTKISSVTDTGAVFADAAVEAVVLQCSKEAVSYIETFKWENEIKSSIGLIDRKNLHPGDIVNLYSNPKTSKLFNTLDLSNQKLTDHLSAEIERGIEKGKNALEERSGRNRIKCFTGTEVNSVLSKQPTKFIAVDWSQKSVYKRKDIFQGPKVLVRRVTNDLIASVDYSDFVCLNTLYILKPTNNLDVETLACYINSSVMKFWFKYKYVNDDALFPYIRKNQLEDIPLPKDVDQLFSKIKSIATKVVHSSINNEVILRKIDLEICKAFKLSENDLDAMIVYLRETFAKAA